MVKRKVPSTDSTETKDKNHKSFKPFLLMVGLLLSGTLNTITMKL